MTWPFKSKRNSPSNFQLGNRALVAKQYKDACRLFEQHAVEVPDDYAKSHTRIAECMRRSNVLSEPVELHPGITLVSQGDRQGAELHYRLAIQNDSDYSPALLGLAELLPPKSDERFRLLKKAAEVGPSYLGLIELGDFYRSVNKDLELAHATYKSALDRSPKEKTAYQKLQDVCKRLGRDAEASEWSAKWKAAYATKKDFRR